MSSAARSFRSFAAWDERFSPRRLMATLAIALVSFVLLLAPDLVFQKMGRVIYPLASPHFWPVLLAMALLWTMTEARWLRILLFILIVMGQTVWFGTLDFFGGVLKPEQLQLAANQADELWLGVRTSLPILAPSLVIVAIAAAALWWTQEGWARRAAWRSKAGGALLLLLLIVYTARIAIHTDLFLLYPSAMTPSALGPIHAVTLALRQSWVMQSVPADAAKVAYILSPGERHDGPVTVVVVMGESINPMRLALFGAPRDTTPDLLRVEASPPEGFRLQKKIGFSAGVATIASVPNFIKIPYYPVGLGASSISLFRIASDNGFRSFYFSAQLAHSLEIAGDARRIERVETQDRWEKRLSEIHDDLLIDFLRETPAAPRRFFFLHQRVNHGPYEENCDHVASEINTLKPEGPTLDDRRRNEYDNGLRCFDRSLGRILDWASRQPGEVYVFYSSDHNELMGEHGMWGHGPTHFSLSIVPMMLFANRPEGAIAKAFAAMRLPTAFDFTALIARTLGTALTVEGYDPNVFYVNAPLPFGLSGFLRVTRRADGAFRSELVNKSGRVIEDAVMRLPERAYDYAK